MWMQISLSSDLLTGNIGIAMLNMGKRGVLLARNETHAEMPNDRITQHILAESFKTSNAYKITRADVIDRLGLEPDAGATADDSDGDGSNGEGAALDPDTGEQGEDPEEDQEGHEKEDQEGHEEEEEEEEEVDEEPDIEAEMFGTNNKKPKAKVKAKGKATPKPKGEKKATAKSAAESGTA